MEYNELSRLLEDQGMSGEAIVDSALSWLLDDKYGGEEVPWLYYYNEKSYFSFSTMPLNGDKQGWNGRGEAIDILHNCTLDGLF